MLAIKSTIWPFCISKHTHIFVSAVYINVKTFWVINFIFLNANLFFLLQYMLDAMQSILASCLLACLFALISPLARTHMLQLIVSVKLLDGACKLCHACVCNMSSMSVWLKLQLTCTVHVGNIYTCTGTNFISS